MLYPQHKTAPFPNIYRSWEIISHPAAIRKKISYFAANGKGWAAKGRINKDRPAAAPKDIKMSDFVLDTEKLDRLLEESFPALEKDKLDLV
ncbi:MAG: hypothetical protein J6T26_09410, partial [Firmicutes bacterium]|nr:hypothetical protein [Bacillota bacterium]